jgi:hypothetical protein
MKKVPITPALSTLGRFKILGISPLSGALEWPAGELYLEDPFGPESQSRPIPVFLREAS